MIIPIILIILSVSGIFSQGTQIDAEFPKGTDPTNLDIMKWTTTSAVSPYKSICSSTNYLFGGYNIFDKNTILTRTLSTASSHYGLDVFLFFCAIDNWTSQNIRIYVDNILIQKYTFPIGVLPTASAANIAPHAASAYAFSGAGYATYSQQSSAGYFLVDSGSNLCGDPTYNDLCYILNFYVSHTASSAVIKFDVECLGGSCSGSWGISNLRYFLASTTSSPCTPISCVRCMPSCRYCNPGELVQEIFCVTSCDPGYTLDGTATRCVKISCTGVEYFNPISRVCVISCPTGYYPNINNHYCDPCDVSCTSCYNSLSTNCLSCTTTFLYNNECVPSCPSNYYYQNSASFICDPCHSTCLTCTGTLSTECLTCDTGRYFLGNECLLNCPINHYYQNSVTHTCNSCDISCLTCSEASSTDCLSCDSGRFFLGNECLLNCPSTNYYQNTITHVCDLCDISCLTCSGAFSTNCLSCNNGRYFFGNQCLLNCPSSHYFENTITNTCDPCDMSCLTCRESLSTDCLSCDNGRFFIGQQCPLNCPIYNYYENSITHVCDSCDISCLTCSGIATITSNCLSCSVGNFLLNSECISNCHINYYENTVTNRCDLCYISCETCSGTLSSNCVTCKSGYFLKGTECLINCPTNNYYENAVSKICEACDVSCLTCSGILSTDCLSCNTGLFFKNSQCLSNCPITNYYPNILTKTCDQCDSSCLTCFGTLSTNCLTCISGYYLKQNECVINCPTNKYYAEVSTLTCEACHASCLTCSGSLLSDCLLCETGLVKNGLYCVITCPPQGYYKNILTNSCDLCHSSCLTCTGSTSNDCLSCDKNYFLLDFQCVADCPVNNYYKNLEIKKCEPCFSSCLTCSGTTSKSCLSCINNFFLLIKECVNMCPINNYFIDSFNCIPCHKSCLTCSGSNLNNCISCQDNFVLNPDNSCTNQLENQAIIAVFSPIDNPFSFSICFSRSNNNNFNIEEIKNLITVKINNYDSLNLESSLVVSDLNNSCFILKNIFKTNINSTDCTLILEMKNTTINSNLYIGFYFSILLNKDNFCLEKEYHNEILKLCQDQIINDIYWYYTDYSYIIKIIFTKMYFPLDYYIIKKILFLISISDFILEKDFTYNIELKLNQVFFIFNFSKSIVGTVSLEIKTNSSIISSLNIYNKTIYNKNYNFNIKLLQNYDLSYETQLMMNQTETISNVGNIVSGSLVIVYFVIKPSSSFAIRGILAADIIQLLKYVDINYPPNVLEIFKKTFSKVFIENDVISENSKNNYPQSLILYRISSTILNNICDELVSVSIVVGIGLIITLIGYYLSIDSKMEGNFFIKFFKYVYKIVVWNLVIGYLMSKYFRLCFFLVVSFRFLQFETIEDIISLLVTFLILIYIIWLPTLIYNVMKVYRKSSLIKNGKKIVPIATAVQIGIEVESDNIIERSTESKIHSPQKNSIIDSPTNSKNYGNDIIKAWTFNIKKDGVLESSMQTYAMKNSETMSSRQIEENIGLSPSTEKNLIFKSLKVQTDQKEKKIYKLNNKKVWDVTPLTILKKTGEELNESNLKKKIVNKVFFLLYMFLCFPCFLSKKLFSLNIGKIERNLSKFTILFRDLKDFLGIHNYFFCFELLRYLLLPFVTIIFFGSPLVQNLLLIVVNGLFSIFIIFKNPFKLKINWFLASIKEIIIDITFICGLLLTLCDLNNNIDVDYRMNLGWAIVLLNIVLLYIIIIDSFLVIIRKIWFGYTLYKNKRNKVAVIK